MVLPVGVASHAQRYKQKTDPQSNIGKPNNGKSATGEKLRNTCRIKRVMFVEWEVSASGD